MKRYYLWLLFLILFGILAIGVLIYRSYTSDLYFLENPDTSVLSQFSE